MLDQNKYIDNKEYTIIENPTFFSVDSRMAETISILNKKGYYTKSYNICSIAKIDSQIYIIQEMKKINIIKDIYDKNLLEIIKRNCSESLFIIFKDKHNFEAPNGFNILNEHLFSIISPINEENGSVTFKNIKQLDKELKDKINDLKKWANSLPNLSNN